MLSHIRAVTLDVTHTLVHPPRLGEIYAEVLARHGAPLDPRTDGPKIARLVKRVWQEFGCSADPARDRFTAHPEGPRGWWRRFLERLCEHLGIPRPSPFAAAELFDRFARADVWEVYPEVPEVLALLRRRGIALGVISNWDHRLPRLLENLRLAAYFDAIVYSSAVGVEKPHPRIFAEALNRLATPPPETLHVGDSRREDVEGAIAVGMAALHLNRRPERKGGGGDLSDLAALPRLLGLEG